MSRKKRPLERRSPTRKILGMTIEHLLDDCPDTSCLGKYTDEYDEHYFDREHGKMLKTLEREKDYEIPNRGREYRFFIPYAGGEEPGTPRYIKYGKQDLARMEGLCKGDWAYVGIVATARVQTGTDIVQKIHSGGLWGIESDAGAEYHTEIEEIELKALRAELVAIGFIEEYIDTVEIERKDA